MKIVENPLLETRHFDFSACRSPSRARRRYRKGIVGRIKITWEPTILQIGDTLYMHPTAAARLRDATDKLIDKTADALVDMLGAGKLFGGFAGGGMANPLKYATGGPLKLERDTRRPVVWEMGRELFLPKNSPFFPKVGDLS